MHWLCFESVPPVALSLQHAVANGTQLFCIRIPVSAVPLSVLNVSTVNVGEREVFWKGSDWGLAFGP